MPNDLQAQAEAIERLSQQNHIHLIGECVGISADMSRASIELIPDYNGGLSLTLEDCIVKEERWGATHATINAVTVREYERDTDGDILNGVDGEPLVRWPGDIGMVTAIGGLDGIKVVEFGVRVAGADVNYAQSQLIGLGISDGVAPAHGRFVQERDYTSELPSGIETTVKYRDIVQGVFGVSLHSHLRHRPDIILHGAIQPSNQGNDVLQQAGQYAETPLAVLNRRNLTTANGGTRDEAEGLRLASNWVATTPKTFACYATTGTTDPATSELLSLSQPYDRFIANMRIAGNPYDAMSRATETAISEPSVFIQLETEPSVERVRFTVLPVEPDINLQPEVHIGSRDEAVWTSNAIMLRAYQIGVLIHIKVTNSEETVYTLSLPARGA